MIRRTRWRQRLAEYITPDMIYGEIRLYRQRWPGKSFLLAEGDKDVRLFSGMVRTDGCEIRNCQGKPNLLSALRKVREAQVSGVAAIADADYDGLTGRYNDEEEDLFYCDGHDSEVMILRSPAFERVLQIAGNPTSLEMAKEQYGLDLRAVLLRVARPLGAIRWLSFHEGWRLSADHLPLDQFIDQRKFTCNVGELIQIFLSGPRAATANGRFRLSAEQVQGKLDQMLAQDVDPWVMCQGHDLVRVYTYCFCRSRGQEPLHAQTEWIEDMLRAAYRPEYFQQTKLYRRLMEWETRHSPFRIVSVPEAAG